MRLFKVSCLIFAISIMMLMSDGQKFYIDNIRAGYITGNSADILSAVVRSGAFDNENIVIGMYMYDSEHEMLEALFKQEIDAAFVEDGSALLNYEETDVKMILAFRTENDVEIGMCVMTEKLETEIELLFRFAKAVNSGNLENTSTVLISPDEWPDYSADSDEQTKRIMKYCVPDFLLEVFDVEMND